MKVLAPALLVLAALSFSACTGEKTESEYLDQMTQLEEQEKYDELTYVTEKYINAFPESERRPQLLKKLAMLYSSNAKDFRRAIEVHRQIVAEVEDQNLVAQSMFMTGYIYANELREFDNARKEYEAFMQRFPDNELAQSVKWELENLGKDLSEIAIFPSDNGQAEQEK